MPETPRPAPASSPRATASLSGLSLEIRPGPRPQTFQVTLHGTIPGKHYELWTKENLQDCNWTVEQDLVGTAGQNSTQTLVAARNRPSLFFAALRNDYKAHTQFSGIDQATALFEIPDAMGAVGRHHFVELLNGVIAVYDKSGNAIGSPLRSKNFFAVQHNGEQLPTGETVDPRIFYDYQPDQGVGRWIACAIDTGSRNVILAVSHGDDPSDLHAGWTRHVVPFARPNNITDYVTLGLDANGIYFAVLYLPDRTLGVAAVKKPEIYSGNFQVTTFHDTTPALLGKIIRPVVNYDSLDQSQNQPHTSAWFVVKGPPTRRTPKTGGAVFYRRMVWNGSQPAWAGDWTMIPDNTYRNYFDLDLGDDAFNAPQKGGDTKIVLSGGEESPGSRLMNSVIRKQILWTSHHIGLDGTNGTYDRQGNPRTGIQWLKFNVTAGALNFSKHGRVYDHAADRPHFYYYPSLAVNQAGDMVVGFCGSSVDCFVGTYYSWVLHDGTVADTAISLYPGKDFFGFPGLAETRWGDYSATSVDPIDKTTFWTVEEYAETRNGVFAQWSTRIAQIIHLS